MKLMNLDPNLPMQTMPGSESDYPASGKCLFPVESVLPPSGKCLSHGNLHCPGTGTHSLLVRCLDRAIHTFSDNLVSPALQIESMLHEFHSAACGELMKARPPAPF